jgi:hypothetical protein
MTFQEKIGKYLAIVAVILVCASFPVGAMAFYPERWIIGSIAGSIFGFATAVYLLVIYPAKEKRRQS